MTTLEYELTQRVSILMGMLDGYDSLARRIKPATLDRGFWSVTLENLCKDAEELVERYAEEPPIHHI